MAAEASTLCLACTVFLKPHENDIHCKSTLHQKNILTHGDQNQYLKDKSFILTLSRNIEVLYSCLLCQGSFISYSTALQHLTFHDINNSSEINLNLEWNHSLKVTCNFGFSDADFKHSTCVEPKILAFNNSQQSSISANNSVHNSSSNAVSEPIIPSTYKGASVKDVPSNVIVTTIHSTSLSEMSEKFVEDSDNPKTISKGKGKIQGIQCEICHITCLGQECFNSHINGKKHKKKVEAANNPKANSVNNGVSKSKKSPVQSYYCTICNYDCPNINNYGQHCNSNKHLSKLASIIPQNILATIPEKNDTDYKYGISYSTGGYFQDNIRNQNQRMNNIQPSITQPVDYYYQHHQNIKDYLYPGIGDSNRQPRDTYSYRY